MGRRIQKHLFSVLLWQRTTSPKKEMYIDGCRKAKLSWALTGLTLSKHITKHVIPHSRRSEVCCLWLPCFVRRYKHGNHSKSLGMLQLLLLDWFHGTAVGRRSLTGKLSILRESCSWRVTIYVGKPSAIGQPTRPTQPFIPARSIDKQ